MTFAEFFENWIYSEKKSTVKEVTFKKYKQASRWIYKLRPNLKLKEVDRRAYQELLNDYGKTHERQTTLDFHTHLKACLTDAFEERVLDRNPANRVSITGREPNIKKRDKFMSLDELGRLIDTLDLSSLETLDWVMLILAKTGIRFAECLALTVRDFDFENLKLNIDKTWNYKFGGGFDRTKTITSVREIEIDWQKEV